MTPNVTTVIQNEAGNGNRTSVKRRADHDMDRMELADEFEVSVKAPGKPEKDASMDAFFIANQVPDKIGEHHKFINAVVTVNSTDI